MTLGMQGITDCIPIFTEDIILSEELAQRRRAVNGRKLDYGTLYDLYINQDKTAREVADIVNSTADSVRATLSYQGIRKGKDRRGKVFFIHAEDHDFLTQEAAVRDMNVNDFLRKIIRTIIKDDLFSALLDDDKEVSESLKSDT